MSPNPGGAQIAYFSMEIALAPEIPTYSGGLGVLAGDTLRSAADLGIPMVGISLLHRKGYFEQILDDEGRQSERPVVWNPEALLESASPTAEVTIDGRAVRIRAWCYRVLGVGGFWVPVYLLDTNLEENSPWDRALTDHLYGGDAYYRLCQEVILGIGGARMLRVLGYSGIKRYHMNEGHSALLVLELLESSLGGHLTTPVGHAMEAVRSQCVFTTHTPVPAGHDRFRKDLAGQALGEDRAGSLERLGFFHDGVLNMTYLALQGSGYINGVAMQHGQISKGMFPDYPISAITNGVHSGTWTAPAMGDLYDRHILAWRRDATYLRYALGIPIEEIVAAHKLAKRELLAEIRKATGVQLQENLMTIGFARRVSTYKRTDLLFSDLERLRWIARTVGPFQLVFGGKAHPRDQASKQLIERVIAAGHELRGDIAFVYVPNYDMNWGRLLTSGTDLWLNTPKVPQEASGTSGMKAALNGVPSFSILDGWWVEGHIEGVTGWAIGHGRELSEDRSEEVASLYGKLETVVLPTFYDRPSVYAQIMRSAIALNGSFFNTQRMVTQYLSNAYFPEMNVQRSVSILE